MTRNAKSQEIKTSVYGLSSFEQLYGGRLAQGSAYHQAVAHHACELIARYGVANQNFLTEKIAVLYVPRGGLPTGEGVLQGLQQLSCQNAFLAASNIKTIPVQLFPAGIFNKTSVMIIADGIIGTGKSIISHLQQVPPDWDGRIEIVSNAASALGLKAIMNYAAAMTQSIACVTGRVLAEDECDWVDVKAKKVYFVGYNKARDFDLKLPDFGDYIQPL